MRKSGEKIISAIVFKYYKAPKAEDIYAPFLSVLGALSRVIIPVVDFMIKMVRLIKYVKTVLFGDIKKITDSGL